jgi:hypothetical protein
MPLLKQLQNQRIMQFRCLESAVKNWRLLCSSICTLLVCVVVFALLLLLLPLIALLHNIAIREKFSANCSANCSAHACSSRSVSAAFYKPHTEPC